jgi:hypothetical protein
MSDDAHADRNQRLKATMKQVETPLNTGAPQVPCGPSQDSSVNRPRGHVDPGSGKKP